MNIQYPPKKRDVQSVLLLAGLGLLTLGTVFFSFFRESLFLPLTLDFAIYFLFLSRVVNSSKSIPLWDIGFMFSSAVLLYSIMPPIEFLVRGIVFTASDDYRLYMWRPTEANLTDHALLYTLFLGIFCAAYGALISRRPAGSLNPSIGSYGSSKVVRLVLMAIVLVSLAIRFFDTPETENYGEASIARVQQAQGRELLVNQLVSVSRGAGLAAKIALVILLISGVTKVAKLFVIVWLAVEILQAVMRLGARVEIVVLILTVMLAYSRFVRPLTWLRGVTCLAVLLVGFSVFGWIRSMSAPGGRTVSFIESGSEFDGIFVTSYDLTRRSEMNLLPARPWTFYFADFLAVIPSQLIPGDEKKTSGGDWYSQLLGGTQSGSGYGFGVLAEAACGFGTIEIVLRALALGLILSWMRNAFLGSSMGFIQTFYYVYIIVNCYNLFRMGSFSLIGICYLFASPVALAVVAFARTSRKSMQRQIEPLLAQ